MRGGLIRTVIGLVVFALIGVPMLTAQERASDAAVRARVKALEAAWNARDAEAIAAGYAPDGDLILGDGPRYTGRDAIRRSANSRMLYP